MKRACQFFSESDKIAADLYLPDTPPSDGARLPGIVLCHGFAGIKEVLLPPYAELFAQHGLVALTFDYRGFGASEGERGRLVPQKQVTDIRNAITFLQTLPEVNRERIGLWGTSFGGANAILAASVDKRVRALSVQLTFSSGYQAIKGTMTEEERTNLDATLQKAWEREVTKNRPMAMQPGQILGNPEAKKFYEGITAQYPQADIKIPITVLRHILELDPARALENVRAPICIIAAGKDTLCPQREAEILFEKAYEPKELELIEECAHFDAYEGDAFKQGSDAALEWFLSHLA